MHKPTPSISGLGLRRLTGLALAAVAWPALAQQPAPTPYEPPQYILIAPAPGMNPYLMYVPVQPATPQPMPPQASTPPSAAPAAQPTDLASPRTERGLSELGRSLRNYFTAEELDLLFEYMKESVVASFKGEEVSLPPDLAFKLEILLVRLQKEGGMYMDNLVKQLERDLKRTLQDKLAPPAVPAEPPQALPQTTPAAKPAPQPAPVPGSSSKLRAGKPSKNA